jgi:hypothetical protein
VTDERTYWPNSPWWYAIGVVICTAGAVTTGEKVTRVVATVTAVGWAFAIGRLTSKRAHSRR